MGWQDRDYARDPARGYRAGAFHGGKGALFGGSVVSWLIAVNVAVFVLCIGNPALLEFGVMRTASVLTKGQIWRLITSQYLHASTTHLLFNMIGLYFLGRALERIWSPKRFLVIYTIAGLCGNFFYMGLGLLGWLSINASMLGASGCILGLLGACAVLFPGAEVYVYFIFPIKIRTAAIAFAAWFVINLWFRGHNAGGDAAHLAGLVFGVWYTKIGERWWDLRGSKRSSAFGRQGAPRRASGAGEFQATVQQRRTDAELIDRLLGKVYEGGLHSLTQSERASLREATERQKHAEQHR